MTSNFVCLRHFIRFNLLLKETPLNSDKLHIATASVCKSFILRLLHGQSSTITFDDVYAPTINGNGDISTHRNIRRNHIYIETVSKFKI